MPVIYVYGTPPNASSEALEQLIDWLKKSAASIKELGIKPEQVTVFIPTDRVEKGLGEEVIVSIENLFERPERTVAVLNRLAEVCARTVQSFFQKALVECFVHTINPVAGVCRLEPSA